MYCHNDDIVTVIPQGAEAHQEKVEMCDLRNLRSAWVENRYRFTIFLFVCDFFFWNEYGCDLYEIMPITCLFHLPWCWADKKRDI